MTRHDLMKMIFPLIYSRQKGAKACEVVPRVITRENTDGLMLMLIEMADFIITTMLMQPCAFAACLFYALSRGLYNIIMIRF